MGTGDEKRIGSLPSLGKPSCLTEGILNRLLTSPFSFVKKTLSININGAIEKLQCEIRLVGDPTRPLSVGIEHDFLVKIQKLLNQKLGDFVSLTELRTIIESKLREPGEEITIEL
jgi:hypothetical protein